MPSRLARLSLLALLAVPCVAGAQAEDVPPAPADLTQIETELGDSTSRQINLAATIEAGLKEQDLLSNRLVAIAETVASQEQALAKAERRIKKLQSQMAVINLDLAAKQDVLSEILAGLQQLEQNPPPALVVAPHDVLDALRSAMMFGAVVPELRGKAEALEQQLSDLQSLKTRLSDEARDRAAALASLDTTRADMLKLIEEKKTLVQASNLDLEQERKRAAELADKAKTVKQLLASLEEERLKQAARDDAATKARLEAERRQKQAQAAPRIAFSLAKGQVSYPTQGSIIKHFGDDSGLGSALDGIVISTAANAQVIAPADGTVEYAGKFRSYGQLVILNAGEGYLVLLAGLGQILATPGQSVKAGEPVGLMGQESSAMAIANGLTQQTTPVLYVEFRKNGDPVDPTPWWNGNRQEAMR